MRAGFEIMTCDLVLFATLTFDETSLSGVLESVGLGHTFFKNYMLSLRRAGKKKEYTVKALPCFEYGDKTGRPHYHVILFLTKTRDDWETPDWVLDHRMNQPHWPHGFSQYELPRSNGGMLDYTIAYVAKDGGALLRPSNGIGKSGLINYANMLGRHGHRFLATQYGVKVRPPPIRSAAKPGLRFAGETSGKQKEFLMPLSHDYVPLMVEAHAAGWLEHFGVEPPHNPLLAFVRGDY